MTENPVRGACEDCGKVFRVPSADRTYTCKACGGTVRVVAAESREEPAAPASRGVRAGREQRARLSRNRRRSRTPWFVLGIAIVAGGGMYAMYRNARAQAAGDREPEADVAKVAASFVEAWEGGRLDELASYYHPDGVVPFRIRLDKVAEHRGWTSGFPKVERHQTEVEPTQDDRARSALVHGETEVTVLSWQFDPKRTLWHVYDLKLTPTPLGPRVDGFRTAWSGSDLEALRAFFRPESADEMSQLVARSSLEGGWSGHFPALERGAITGEEAARDTLHPAIAKAQVESTYATPDGGELLVRWKFIPEHDEWYVMGFRFPE